MKKVYVISALRTPMGILNGKLKSLSEQQLCAVLDDSVVFLICPRQKTWNILESNQWDIEAITEADKARALDGRVDVECAG